MKVKFIIETAFDWFANVLLKSLVLKKRDNNLWIFGAWSGNKYSDNSKYFFEYIQIHLPEIRAVWITKNRSIKKQLLAKGYECYLSNERQGRQLRLKAGFVFYTNGMKDFGHFDICQGSTKVALWHGMPLKRLHYATNNLLKRRKNIFRFAQYLILKTYSNSQRNVTIATSDKSKEFFIECYEVKPQSVFITGQPRNDILFEKSIKPHIYKALNHKENERFVLYMPTWRESDKKGVFFLNSIIDNFFNDISFLKKLTSRNVKLYIKPHPNVNVNYKNSSNIIILDHKYELDPQELMVSADVLITDYSSVFIDYALTDRPIHFFVPDLEEYAKDRLGVFLDIDDYANFWIEDIEVFKKVLIYNSDYDKKGLLNTSKINKIYDDPSLERGKYNEQLVNVLKSNFFK